jgi:tetratricopeptide (TPR) repeat protein
VADTLLQLGELLSHKGDGLAAARYEQAIEIYERTSGADEIGKAIYLFAKALPEGETARAFELLQRALALHLQTLGPDHPDTASILVALAERYIELNRLAEARATFEKALAILGRSEDSDQLVLAAASQSLGMTLLTLDEASSARPHLERAVAITEKILGPDHSEVADALTCLAALRRLEGDFDAALRALARALAIRDLALGPNHVQTAAGLVNLAILFMQLGVEDDFGIRHHTMARAMVERALIIQTQELATGHPELEQTISVRNALLEDDRRLRSSFRV